jgi:hypothetical protein
MRQRPGFQKALSCDTLGRRHITGAGWQQTKASARHSSGGFGSHRWSVAGLCAAKAAATLPAELVPRVHQSQRLRAARRHRALRRAASGPLHGHWYRDTRFSRSCPPPCRTPLCVRLACRRPSARADSETLKNSTKASPRGRPGTGAKGAPQLTQRLRAAAAIRECTCSQQERCARSTRANLAPTPTPRLSSRAHTTLLPRPRCTRTRQPDVHHPFPHEVYG